MNNQVQYTFKGVDKCNMCGSPTVTHKILGKRLNAPQGKNPRKKAGITVTVVKCTNCGLIYSNPLPIPFKLSDHYGVSPEEYWNEEYFNITEEYYNSQYLQLKKLWTLMSVKKDDKALDIGAGIGKFMTVLARNGFETHGIEPSETFYKAAVERLKIEPAKLQMVTLEDAVYPEGSFDFINFQAVLEHLYDPSTALLKIIKWLKPGGILRVEVPSADWLVNKLINTYYRLRGTDYVGNISPMHRPYHLYEFGLKSFAENAKQNNYTIVDSDYFICQTYMPAIIDVVLVPYMRMTKTGMVFFVWIKRNG